MWNRSSLITQGKIGDNSSAGDDEAGDDNNLEK